MNNTENNKKPKCPHCNDSRIHLSYNKDGDATQTPCPKCTDELTNIRNWDGYGYYRRSEGS